MNFAKSGKGLFLAFLIVFLAGCGSESSGKDLPAATVNKQPDPVTVSFLLAESFKGQFVETLTEQLKHKYPYITLEITSTKLPDLVATNSVPDLVAIAPSGVQDYADLGLAVDMEGLARKNGFDLNQLGKPWVELFRTDVNGKSTLVGLPIYSGFGVLYYNKDIFDKFSVPYPKDDMTWEQTIELAKKVARQDGGVQYSGIGFAGLPTDYMATQLSVPTVDAKTNKAAIQTDAWKRSVDLSKRLFDASAIKQTEFRNATQFFVKDKTLAMLVATNNIRMFTELNWDLVTLPIFKDKPGISRGPSGVAVTVTSTSPHKDDAFRVLGVLLSEEVQNTLASEGRPSILKKDNLKQVFVKSSSNLEGKNAMAIFKNPPSDPAPTTKYDGLVRDELIKSYDDIMLGRTDINTGLREAEERGNKAIEDAMKK
jgi:multiple sugar transport system substrate-binding protein